MYFKTLWLICGMYLGLAEPIQIPNGEATRALAAMRASLVFLFQGHAYQGPSPLPAPLSPALDRLQRALERDAAIRVNRSGSNSIELEVKNRILFNPPPTLPPENKQDGTWSFETVRFEVESKHLFIFGLTFKAGRTIRIKRVTLYFQDGTRVTHDAWARMENGNGKAFPKRIYLPKLTAYGKDEPRRARAIRAITITGSAQDGRFSSDLDFLFEVPDADETPYREALSLVVKWRKAWRLEEPSRGDLSRYLADLKTLERMLGIETGSGR